QYLTDGTYDGTIESVFVSGDNVYASGGEKGGGSSGIYYFAKIWVNGEVQTLTDGSTNARGNSIFVSDGNVYVGGYEYNDLPYPDNRSIAKIWKNGVPTALTNGTHNAVVTSIYISEND